MKNRKNTELFIARRLSGKGAGGTRPNIMVRIAAITTGISLAVMIVALAVITGFKREITEKIIGFGGHLQIVNLDGNASLETEPIGRNPDIGQVMAGMEGFTAIHAYAVKGGIIRTDEAMQGIMLKGVDPDYDWEFFSASLTEGGLPGVGDSIRRKDILISRRIAEMMKLGVGDRAEILFMREGGSPRRDRFNVSGIYDSGFEEMDLIVVMTDIRNVQRLNGWDEDQITGYEITSSDFAKLESFSKEAFDALFDSPAVEGHNLMMTDITERFPSLFDWLKAHDVNAAVVIVIMLLVTLLNMVSALLIILLERTGMIGVLKALGMKNGGLQRIFLIRTGRLLLTGMFWGNAVGIGLCLIQQWTGVLKLDSAGYFLSVVPVALEWKWLLALNAGTFAVMLLLLALPTKVISGIRPEKTIRYQ